jgi:hypothetical protein
MLIESLLSLNLGSLGSLGNLGASSGHRTTPPPARTHLDEIGSLPHDIAPHLGAPGAALDDVLALIREVVPSATGLVVQNGRLFVVYAEPPDEAACAASRMALSDQRALSQLASRRASRPAVAAVAPATPATSDDLRAALLDDQLSDEAWMRAFRRYQVARLSAKTE